MQRGRCYGTREIEGLPVITPMQTGAAGPHSWGEAGSRITSVSMEWDVLDPERFQQ